MFTRYMTGLRKSWRTMFGAVMLAFFALALVPAHQVAAATPGWTTAVELNVRSGPGKDYASIDTIVKGTSVLIHTSNDAGDWLNVSYNKGGQHSGWISAKYVQRGTQPVPHRVTLTVVNTTDETIYLLHVAPTEFSEWGNDQLGINRTVAPGESFSMSLEPGMYDMKAENDELEILDVQYNVSLTADYVWYAQ